jgi:ABC-2 type transport system ATP-binding protein
MKNILVERFNFIRITSLASRPQPNSHHMEFNPVHELLQQVQHGDLALANRRLLDLCFDTSNPSLIRQSIEISKALRKQLNEGDKEAASQFLDSEIKRLGDQILEAERAELHQELLLEVDNVSKQYAKGSFRLQPISLSVHRGEIIGIVGENGNGKTTMLRCLAAQLELSGGNIQFTQLPDADLYAIRNYVAFIPQRIPRWYGVLQDNLHFSASLAGLHGEENELAVEFMLERLGLGEHADKTWDQISSGYRTRFELARVLLAKPGLLILDEPLANLDINAQQTILNDLRMMARSRRRPMGIVLSSQQLHEVEHVADRMVLIRNGSGSVSGTRQTEVSDNACVVEIETKASREKLLAAMQGALVQLHFNGGFYTVETHEINAQELIKRLVSADVPISYYRDISLSTKRFFTQK